METIKTRIRLHFSFTTMYSNDTFRLFIEQLPVGVLVCDRDGKMLQHNRVMKNMWSTYFEESLDQCTDPDLIKIYHMNDVPYTKEDWPLFRVISTGTSIKNELVKVKIGSELRYLHISASPVSADGELVCIYLTCEDITDRKKMEEEACSLKVASQFLATVSHEIRTPIHGILGMLDIFSESELSDEQREHLCIMQRSTKNLLVILNDLLDYSKWKANKVEFEHHVFDVRQVFNDVYVIFSALSTMNPCMQFSVTVDDDVPKKMFGDSQRLKQCLNNILSNAIKFVVPKVRNNVSVRVSMQDAKTMSIKISDTGIGMNSDTLSRLFQPFTQADSSITRLYGGTGLGLAIVQQIIHQMHGQVSVESELGKGSTFTLIYPLLELPEDESFGKKRKLEDDAKQAQPQMNKRYKLRPNGKETVKILLAEDNLVSKMIATTVLQRKGYAVSAVENGLEVLEMISKDPDFDILLLDIQMPKLGGHETCIRLRERNWNKPIIALTASAMEDDKTKCLSIGMDDYMSKPFEVNDLERKIDHWVSLSVGGK